ncbi:hypothetical protein PV433_17505 [Paenibacillus sp. GYB004]|uniref:hypothetical protein n=1 Tax=Paenibacillus sp. GYB004 TaxID=2994393 RepID=UPI002F96D24F
MPAPVAGRGRELRQMVQTQPLACSREEASPAGRISADSADLLYAIAAVTAPHRSRRLQIAGEESRILRSGGRLARLSFA